MGKVTSLSKQFFEGWLSNLQINNRAFGTIRRSKSAIESFPPQQGFRQKQFYGSRVRQQAPLLSWKHQCSFPFLFSSTEECLSP
jgi:hypothetical protein